MIWAFNKKYFQKCSKKYFKNLKKQKYINKPPDDPPSPPPIAVNIGDFVEFSELTNLSICAQQVCQPGISQLFVIPKFSQNIISVSLQTQKMIQLAFFFYLQTFAKSEITFCILQHDFCVQGLYCQNGNNFEN